MILVSLAFCIPLHGRAVEEKRKTAIFVTKTVPILLVFLYSLLVTLLCFPKDVYAMGVTAGLFLGMLGDIFIINHFIAGGVFFFLGHIGYCFAFLNRGGVNLGTLIVTVCVLVIFIVIRKKLINLAGERRYLPAVGLVYAIMLAVMVTLGFSMPATVPSVRSWLGAIGGFVFVLSDAFLLRNGIRNASRKERNLSLSVYYAAQLLMALSVTLPAALP